MATQRLTKLQPFGAKERNYTEEEKEKIRDIVKYSPYTQEKIQKMGFDADRETATYFRAAKIGGLATFAACYCWLPVVRKQPALRRAFISALPAYYLYSWTHNYGEELRWSKVYYAFQKLQVSLGEHEHVFV